MQVAQLKQLNSGVDKLKDKLSDIEQLDGRLENLMKMKNKKKNRRAAKDVPKNHACPYDNCFRVYGGEVSLNLHIKTNHNGGTKTERLKIIVMSLTMQREVQLARSRGEPLPEITINLPPGFLDRISSHDDEMDSRDEP
jgi:hypothetical protein